MATFKMSKSGERKLAKQLQAKMPKIPINIDESKIPEGASAATIERIIAAQVKEQTRGTNRLELDQAAIRSMAREIHARRNK